MSKASNFKNQNIHDPIKLVWVLTTLYNPPNKTKITSIRLFFHIYMPSEKYQKIKNAIFHNCIKTKHMTVAR